MFQSSVTEGIVVCSKILTALLMQTLCWKPVDRCFQPADCGRCPLPVPLRLGHLMLLTPLSLLRSSQPPKESFSLAPLRLCGRHSHTDVSELNSSECRRFRFYYGNTRVDPVV